MLKIESERPKSSAPFGNDVWNCWEVSALLDSGLPFNGVLRFRYENNTTHVVNREYMQMYLETLHMTKFGQTIDDAALNLEIQIKEDLTRALKDGVECVLHTRPNIIAKPIFDFDFAIPIEKGNFYYHDGANTNLFQLYMTDKPTWSKHQSDLLKTYGNVYVYVKGKQHITDFSFQQYIVSFRNDVRSNLSICEAIYEDLSRVLSPEELFVACLYTRRGGIDTNFVRASHEKLIYKFANNLVTLTFLQDKGFRQ